MAPRGISPYSVATIAVLAIGLVLTTFNIHKLTVLQDEHYRLAHGSGEKISRGQPHYAVFAKHEDSGYLKHVYNVLERAGYTRVSYNISNDWSVMWAHDYPFKKIKPVMTSLLPHQRVNKLPGSGYVTNKVSLATSGLPSIPKAFRIPDDKKDLLKYAKENPDVMFVQKNQNHRGIKIEKISELDLEAKNSFVQVFVDDPLLVDGYKFDIGIYTMITSVDPLRIYVYEGDVLVRFCPELYHPFDPKNRNKYVVHDDYRPTWKVPTLAKLYSDLGYTFKETLNAHIRTLGHDPDAMWEKMYDVIRMTYKSKEPEFIKAGSHYANARSFFEMVRFDFVLDSKLNIYLMEVNMSPNLSSKHFAENRLLYEQVVYNLLRLVGVARPGVTTSLTPGTKEEMDMQVSDKDLVINSDQCASEACSKPDSCSSEQCWLCKTCLSSEDLVYLRMAFLEHCNRHQTRRLYPKQISRTEALRQLNSRVIPEADRTTNNQKMHQWFIGKCTKDERWCH